VAVKSENEPQQPAREPAIDPAAMLRSPRYVRLLILAAVLGVPLAAFAYGFLALVHYLEDWVFDDLPRALGFASEPWWWPLATLTIAGILTGAAIHYLPGTGGHRPAEGLKTGGPAATVAELPGILLAALAGLGLGAVIGPEAPLIALGGGLAVVALRLSRREVPATTSAVVAAAGSFAAISALFGSPLLGAFLLMEASGIAGATLGLVLVPGLLSAAIGALVFVGVGTWTGLGPLSLAVPGLGAPSQPTVGQFGWAIVIGLLAAVTGSAIRRLSRALEPSANRHPLTVTPLAGLTVGAIAVLFEAVTGESSSLVLFSGQAGLDPLLNDGKSWPAWTLVALIGCKGAAYLISLSAFRGGPVFPSLFIGATGGLALTQLPGLPVTAAAAMGIAAMATVMLGLPLTAVLLATVLIPVDGLELIPLVTVAVVVAYVGSARLGPRQTSPPSANQAPD
jgi:H+/Cl- antiporter ClcA